MPAEDLPKVPKNIYPKCKPIVKCFIYMLILFLFFFFESSDFFAGLFIRSPLDNNATPCELIEPFNNEGKLNVCR